MLRKMIVVVAAAVTLGGGLVFYSTEASARWGGVGWGGGIGVARIGGWGWRRPGWGWGGPGWGWGGPGWGLGGVGVIVIGASCWRWVPTVWGPTRVWVC